MKELICRPHCKFFKPGKGEREKCLAFDWLSAWAVQDARLSQALADLSGKQISPGPALSRLGPVVCSRCLFRTHGCDFAAPPQDPACTPCGGLKVFSALVDQGHLREEDFPGAWENFLDKCHLRLADHVSLRLLETPHLYDRQGDELYEVNQEGFDWLRRCEGTTPGLAREAEPEFLTYLLENSLLACATNPSPRDFHLRRSPLPSLRHLEMLLTTRCNLRCRHCYLEAGGVTDLYFPLVQAALREFEEMQGLRVLLSGGEPLLREDLPLLARELRNRGFKVKLDSNGLRPEVLEDLAERGLVDLVAMDLKAPLNDLAYRRAAGRPVDLAALRRSVDFLIHSGLDHEFRSTIWPAWHGQAELMEMARELRGCQVWTLQALNPRNAWRPEELGPGAPYSAEELARLQAAIADPARRSF